MYVPFTGVRLLAAPQTPHTAASSGPLAHWLVPWPGMHPPFLHVSSRRSSLATHPCLTSTTCHCPPELCSLSAYRPPSEWKSQEGNSACGVPSHMPTAGSCWHQRDLRQPQVRSRGFMACQDPGVLMPTRLTDAPLTVCSVCLGQDTCSSHTCSSPVV